MSEAAAPSGLGPVAGTSWLLSDERLVRRAAEGDERAFAAIYRRYHQDLYRFCLAILGESQDAQDALQNTMIKVMRALPGERREVHLKPWLYRIAHNESIEVLRRRSPVDQLDPELAAAAPGPAEEAEQRARLRRLVADVEQLPDRQRGALVMRELGGLGFEEIGGALDTSPAVARQTLYEARLSLRQMEEGRELSCDTITRALSDADGRVTRRRDIRAHLRECQSCREFRQELRRRRRDFAAVAPLPAAAAAGILQGVLGAGGAGTGGVAFGAAGSAAAGKALGGAALGTSALAKSAATVAVVAAIGVGAADRGGLVDVGLPGGSGSSGAPAGSEVGGGASGAGGRSVAPAGVQGPRAGDVRPGPGGARPDNPASQAPAAAATGSANADGQAGAPGASAEHRNDAGRHGNPPSAASHGQQTAAHKGGAGGKGGDGGKSGSRNGGRGQGGAPTKEQSAHPPKPAHPAPPSAAGSQKQAAPQGTGTAEAEKTAPPQAPTGSGAILPPGEPAE